MAYLDELYSEPEILDISQFMGKIESKDLRVVQGGTFYNLLS